MFTTLVFQIMFQMQTMSLTNTSFTGKTSGEYYEMIDLKYDPQLGKTLALWIRYNVDYTGDDTAHPMLSQIRYMNGHATKEQMRVEALPVIGNIEVFDNAIK